MIWKNIVSLFGIFQIYVRRRNWNCADDLPSCC